MNAAIITTINHNIGDDFVREGILYLLGLRAPHLSYSCIHKHIPVTARPEFEWVHSLGITSFVEKIHRGSGLFLSRLLDRIELNVDTDKVLNADLVVQSGAPVYWLFPDGNGCHNNEWYHPLVKRRFSTSKKISVFVNIGAGSCLPFDSDGIEVTNSTPCSSYIKEMCRQSTVTTVRDRVAQSILQTLGFEVPLLPCPSIFARSWYGIEPADSEFVVLNFMPQGGHNFFSHNIQTSRWENTIKGFYERIKGRSPIVVSCHNGSEAKWIKKVLPNASIFLSKRSEDYLRLYSRAKFFIGCRVHAAYAVASYGRPALAIGSDTRLLMMEVVKLPHMLISDLDEDSLVNQYELLEAKCGTYVKEFETIRSYSIGVYLTTLVKALDLIKESANTQ